jgi:hypothetical protein
MMDFGASYEGTTDVRDPGAKYIQVKLSPQLKKEFVRLCQRITDDIEREDRQMNIGPMATYAACYLLTLEDGEATEVVLRGKAHFDANPLPKSKEGNDTASSGQAFKGHEGVLPTKKLHGKINDRPKRRPKGNQTRARSVD